jgi:protein-tyrosine-phosphatase
MGMSASDPTFRVLFVCTGNTCRSPMAAAFLRHALGADAARVTVESAGTAAWEGQPATQPSIEVAGRDGVDLSAHRSQRVTPALVRAADLILVMERGHVGAVRTLGGDPGRTHVLSEWPPPGEPDLPISDPFGASREAYEECWRRITHHVERVVPFLQEELRARSV